jgi:hypothetical protein
LTILDSEKKQKRNLRKKVRLKKGVSENDGPWGYISMAFLGHLMEAANRLCHPLFWVYFPSCQRHPKSQEYCHVGFWPFEGTTLW